MDSQSFYSSLYGERREEINERNEIEAEKEQLSLSAEQIEELRESFKLYDKDGNGSISPFEIKAVLLSIGEEIDEDDVHEIIKEIDEDDNGEIDFIEFIHLMYKVVREPHTEKDIEACFKAFDQDGDDYITPSELKKVFLSLGEKVDDDLIQEMVKELDHDEDGLVNYDDFKTYLENADLLRKAESEEDSDNNDDMPEAYRASKASVKASKSSLRQSSKPNSRRSSMKGSSHLQVGNSSVRGSKSTLRRVSQGDTKEGNSNRKSRAK